jgi:hypothetical protein
VPWRSIAFSVDRRPKSKLGVLGYPSSMYLFAFYRYKSCQILFTHRSDIVRIICTVILICDFSLKVYLWNYNWSTHISIISFLLRWICRHVMKRLEYSFSMLNISYNILRCLQENTTILEELIELRNQVLPFCLSNLVTFLFICLKISIFSTQPGNKVRGCR